MNGRLIFLWICVCCSIRCLSQIKSPQTPQYSSFTPASSGAKNYSPNQPTTNTVVRIGATSQDILNQRNNNQTETTPEQKRKEVEHLISENRFNPPKRIDYATFIRDSITNAAAIAGFYPALQHLQDMLHGKAKLSVADAYYTIEYAYGNPYLTREQFNTTIKQSAGFIKKWMIQNGLSMTDNNMVHYAIQKFMSEELSVTNAVSNRDGSTKVSTTSHGPFYYDYNDYQYQQDYRNSFLTKCLATGFGQCNSMPAVYLVLAEALGVKAYLTFAPQHSFIKYPDNEGGIVNYEPTSNWKISDKWYQDNLFISPQAIASGIYLDTLNNRQVVANSIFDLAVEYMRVDRSLNEDFINACMKAGIPHFPKNNNLESLFIYSMHLKTELREVMRKKGITDIGQIDKVPEAKALYREYLGNEGYITKLGYQDMPAGMYEEMLNQHEFKGRIQKGLQVNVKEKRNLFATMNQ